MIPVEDLTPKEQHDRKEYLIRQLDSTIEKLQEILALQQANYEPYKEQQTKTAIRALLNIRGIKNIKAFNRVNN